MKFVSVAGLEQAIALRREGLLYFKTLQGGFESLPPATKMPPIASSMEEWWVQEHYAYLLED